MSQTKFSIEMYTIMYTCLHWGNNLNVLKNEIITSKIVTNQYKVKDIVFINMSKGTEGLYTSFWLVVNWGNTNSYQI